MTTRQNHPFKGAAAKPPTLKHRPAIWECMLGTVYAVNDAGKVEYFDYNWDAAREYAGVTADRDPRVAKASSASNGWSIWALPGGLRRRQTALWLLKEVAK